MRPSGLKADLTDEALAVDPTAWTICFKGYLPVDDGMEERLQRICAEIGEIPDSAVEVDESAGVVTIDCSKIPGWTETSKRLVHAVRAGEHIVVKPPWEDYDAQPGDIVLEIDPGASFGSGLHESTRLCLKALETYLEPGGTMIDFGTGSGILAVAAAKLGASRVTAVEGDEEAVPIARANVHRNGLDGVIGVIHALSLEDVGDPADLITANITAETIVEHLEALARVLKPGGILISSGMTTRNVSDVERRLPEAALRMTERLKEGHWVALVAARMDAD